MAEVMTQAVASHAELAESSPEPPAWPARRAWLWAWRRPATLATRTAGAPLKWAYAVHVLAGVATTFLIVAIVSAIEAYSRPSPWTFATAFVSRFADNVADVARGIRRFPLEVTAILLTIVGLIELGFVALALLVMPWGARDERLRDGFRAALRQTWLHTTHALPAVLLGGAIVLAIELPGQNWHRDFESRNPFTLSWPGPAPATAPANSPEWAVYNAKVAEYNAAQTAYSQKFWSERPWYVARDEELIGIACIGLGVWVLWALLRAVGAPRPLARIEHPPMCEWCGYNLTLTPLEARCPECGQPVNDSLGPQARPGTPWEHTTTAGTAAGARIPAAGARIPAAGARIPAAGARIPAAGARIPSRTDDEPPRAETPPLRPLAASWWRCAVDAVRRPAELGRSIRLSPPTTRHRMFPLRLYPIMAILGPSSILTLHAADMLGRGQSPFAGIPNDAPFVLTILSCLAPTMLVVLTLATAGFYGIGLRLAVGRNLTSAAVQMSCYLTPLVVLGTVVAILTGAAVVRFEDIFDELRRVTRLDDEILAFFAWVLLNLPIWITYQVALIRGTLATRYANQ